MPRTRIKICGITRADDALAAAQLGADAIGLVFHPQSARFVAPEVAAEIARALPPFVTLVGLFVNPAAEWVRQVCAAVPLDLIQFHGDEPPAVCAGFDRPFIKVAHVRPGLDLVEFASSCVEAGARALVLDAATQSYGGAGVRFDWTLVPAALPLPVVLAGGLDPDNVGEAIARLHPYAVDVSSGVEAPNGVRGVKDHARIAQFIAGVNNASV